MLLLLLLLWFAACRQLGVGPVAVTSLLIGNGIRNMLPGAENIDNPSNPSPQFVDLQNEYNHRVSGGTSGCAVGQIAAEGTEQEHQTGPET